MSDVAVSVRGLGKRYHLGATRERYGTLRDSIQKFASAPLRAMLRRAKAAEKNPPFWALKDVSFDVKRGEVVGIIGRNGAGKSTLLKILSRITEPTEGEADIHGRVGSLLEVGTGFHPELTGRENVYLNGAILGMKRAEIARKFDEIVAFAEVEKFIDTPVKHYSSGMYMRLAFAVAAHLEPEILIVDEVLAVGDAQFQKKCLGKMGDVAKGGRTVLFVSHNMAAVRNLCNRCIWLSTGLIAGDGEADPVIDEYGKHGTFSNGTSSSLLDHPGRITKRAITRMTRVCLIDKNGAETCNFGSGSSFTVGVDFESPECPIRPVLGVVLKDKLGSCLTGINNRIVPGFQYTQDISRGRICLTYSSLPFQPGSYSIDLYLGNESVDIDVVLDAASFHVTEADFFGSGKLPPAMAGPFLTPATWSLTAIG